MPQESSASACGDSLLDTRDLLCAMLRSAEGGTSDSGGSEVSAVAQAQVSAPPLLLGLNRKTRCLHLPPHASRSSHMWLKYATGS